MARYFCQSIEDCVFDLTGKCCYCGRKEPKKVGSSRDEEPEAPEFEQEEIIESPKGDLF